MVGVSMTWETVLKGPSIRKVERHQPRKMVLLEWWCWRQWDIKKTH